MREMPNHRPCGDILQQQPAPSQRILGELGHVQTCPCKAAQRLRIEEGKYVKMDFILCVCVWVENSLHG